MKKDLRQIVQRLMRQGIVVSRDASYSKHPMLILCNGVRYPCAVTPSDYRGLRNMECEIKRLSRLQPRVTLASPV